MNISYKVLAAFMMIGSVGGVLSDDKIATDSDIAKSAVSDIFLSLPLSVKHICVVKVDLSGSSDIKRQILDFRNVNNRITIDPSWCSERKTYPGEGVVVMYLGKINQLIEKMSGPSDPKYTTAFKVATTYARNGHSIFGATTDECSSEIRAFVYQTTAAGMRHVDSLTIDSTKCATEAKR